MTYNSVKRLLARCSKRIGYDLSGPHMLRHTQGYETKASAEKGIEAVKTHAPKAKVEDHSEAKSS
jgi:hypothetical protein